MLGRIVEIGHDQRYLCVQRGFMVVRSSGDDRSEVGHVPLDDIAAVIANAHGLSYSNNLLVALAERGAPFVLCARNHQVAAMLWPTDGNFEQSRRMDAQLAATRPTQKRLWAELVRGKLLQQAAVLQALGRAYAPLSALAMRVRSGDPGNLEAQGAQRYWKLLHGPDFRRDATAGGLNALLNYGYTVLRSATARAVVAAGLHPGLGVFHRNGGNPMRLIDDLMEPFRPLIDLKVWQLHDASCQEVNDISKRELVHTLYADVETAAGTTPVMVCLQQLATSLAQVYLGETRSLDMPPILTTGMPAAGDGA